jgi:hypothetical protein
LRGISDEPFLDVEAADDGGFALGLNLGELHGVLGVFLFVELNGFSFLVHVASFRWWWMMGEVRQQSRQKAVRCWTVGNRFDTSKSPLAFDGNLPGRPDAELADGS